MTLSFRSPVAPRKQPVPPVMACRGEGEWASIGRVLLRTCWLGNRGREEARAGRERSGRFFVCLRSAAHQVHIQKAGVVDGALEAARDGDGCT